MERLREAHGNRLVSVILYGSAAAADNLDAFSDCNILCVLTAVGLQDLRRAEPIFRWWRGRGNPAPLLMSADEVRASADAFAIEFHDMRENRRVLLGEDVVANLTVRDLYYQAQVEHELRAKLLRLRQKAGAVFSDGKALLRLMLDSVSTFCVLARHALLLSGVAVGRRKRDVAATLGVMGADPGPFLTLLDLRERTKDDTTVDPLTLFGDYLKQIEAVVGYVDRLSK